MHIVHHSQSGALCKYITNPGLRKEPDAASSVSDRAPADETSSSNSGFPFRGAPFVPPWDDGMGRCDASFVATSVARVSFLESGFVESCG